ncbi:MAG: asparagine synthetase A [Chloroflexia bacterium]
MDAKPRIEELAERCYRRVSDQGLKHALAVQSEAVRAMGEFLRSRGFVEISPVILSPITDPLRHATGRAEVEYYGHRYQLTRSMIFHKQIAVLGHERIFAFSPNVRLEPVELADTGRHLVEFTQLDLEVRGATREDIITLGEELLVYTVSWVQERCAEALAFFGRRLRVPSHPFRRVSYRDAYDRYGTDFEVILSQQSEEPLWVVDMPLEAREFYDREDPARPGTLVDMDLIYPEGFGEALSGGEREHVPERIVARMERSGLDPEDYRLYLEIARRGLYPSAGFGIGVERLTRFLCGLKRIEDAVLFPKVPGTLSL